MMKTVLCTAVFLSGGSHGEQKNINKQVVYFFHNTQQAAVLRNTPL